MDTLPPFAIGPHYLMSFDCAQFIGSNFEHLQGVGTLEDVSVALWLLAIQVGIGMEELLIVWYAPPYFCHLHFSIALNFF